MSKNQLDEMQLQRRNKFGNQAFMMLFYLLMFDIILYGLGFRWLKYPTNVFVIMLACMFYYEVRLIWHGAYLGPENKSRVVNKKIIYILILTSIIAAITAFLLQKCLSENKAQEVGDSGALILFVGSGVAFIIIITLLIIRSKRDRKTEE